MKHARACPRLLAVLLSMVALGASATVTTPGSSAASNATGTASVAAQNTRLKLPTALLLQEVPPWGSTANETILTKLGVAFVTATAKDLAAMSDATLAWYSVIIVASDQPQPFYDTLKGQMGRINQWVMTGARTLEFHVADHGWNNGRFTGVLPRNVASYNARDDLDVVVLPEWPLMRGVPTSINGSSASQNALMVQPPVKVILTDTVGNATLVDYCWKRGRVIATGLTLEYAWDHDWDAKPVLENMLTASTSAPGCHSDIR
ncbi:hypothetical protein [Ideonella sp. B508-1]|uniref:hypothetical protein n=2 Tax=Ideonella sp. B508-1 TaxID=137716 RepID=UPI0011D1E197|nr:hypothetical protein [Ideonella sp. B508-1]